jgi:hypothetical protein
MVDRELRQLRRAIAAVQRRRRRRYPAKLRARISAWVAKRRAKGAWWCDVARPLGVPASTLKRWAEPSPTAPLALRPVDVIDVPLPGTVTLVSPTGLRIEGVTIDAAIAILRGLA